MKISVVVPIMNEEGNLILLSQNIIEVLNHYIDYEIIFIDDGSTDNSLSILSELNIKNNKIKYISFSRNFGHQNALKAGLDHAHGDCVISMDGDMQHPPELIRRMIEIWQQEKADIVFTIRNDKHEKISLFKKFSSRFFYKIMNFLSDVKIEPGSTDFRLLDKSVVDYIKCLPENPIFFRGLIPWIGYKQIALEYEPHERFWGKTKYTFKKMFNFAINGILSFSIKPLTISIYIGIILAFLSLCYGIYSIIIKLFTNYSISGWSSVISVITFIGGIQLIILGIIGTYLGKLFISSRGRPMYIIKQKCID